MRVLYVGGRAQTHWVLSYCSSQIVSDVLEEHVHKNVYVLQSIFINLCGLQTASINTDRNGGEFLGVCGAARGLWVCLWFSAAVHARCVWVGTSTAGHPSVANAKEKLAQSRARGIGWASGGVSSTTLFTFYTHIHAVRHMRWPRHCSSARLAHFLLLSSFFLLYLSWYHRADTTPLWGHLDQLCPPRQPGRSIRSIHLGSNGYRWQDLSLYRHLENSVFFSFFYLPVCFVAPSIILSLLIS